MSFYGNQTQAIQVDGVFMATTGKVLKNIELRKPKVFEGDWHWYDAYYCLQAHSERVQQLYHASNTQARFRWKLRPAFLYGQRNFNKLFGKYLPVVVRKLQK